MRLDKHYIKGYDSVRAKVEKDFPDVDPKVIRTIVAAFWTSGMGVAKYFRGYKSFSVARLFFFVCNPKKEENRIERYKKSNRDSHARTRRKMGIKKLKKKIIILKEPEQKKYYIAWYTDKLCFANRIKNQKNKYIFNNYEDAMNKLIKMYKFTHYNYDDLSINGLEKDVRARGSFKCRRRTWSIFCALEDEPLVTKRWGDKIADTNEIINLI